MGPVPFQGGMVTAFCRETMNGGSTWIEVIGPFDPGTSLEEIKQSAVNRCADAWSYPAEFITCIGLAAGDIDIILWDDTTLE